MAVEISEYYGLPLLGDVFYQYGAFLQVVDLDIGGRRVKMQFVNPAPQGGWVARDRWRVFWSLDKWDHPTSFATNDGGNFRMSVEEVL